MCQFFRIIGLFFFLPFATAQFSLFEFFFGQGFALTSQSMLPVQCCLLVSNGRVGLKALFGVNEISKVSEFGSDFYN